MSISKPKPQSVQSAQLCFGRYTVLEKLGEGNSGFVCKAKDTKNNFVAIKVLSKCTPDEEALQKAVDLWSELKHPNLVRCFGYGDQKGLLYLVLECVSAVHLKQKVSAATPLSTTTALSYFRQALRAIEFVHRHGAVHGDLRPNHLLLTGDGNIKVSDFGLQGALYPEKDQSEVGTQIMTELTERAAYRAPELSAEGAEPDVQTDIYSLGCTLFYLLTGKRPYAARNILEMERAHHEHPIPHVRDVNPAVPASLESILRKMMAKATEVRYASIEEVLADLEGIVSGDTNASGSEGDETIADLPPDMGHLVHAITGMGLLTQQQVGEFLASFPPYHRPATAEEFAQSLLQARLATGYQLGRLRRDEGQDLVYDDFLVYDKLAENDRSELFLAKDCNTGEWVALKAFREPIVRSESSKEQFLRDVEACSRLAHEHLVQLRGGGVKDERPFLIQEYVQCLDLERYINRHRAAPWEQAVDWITQAARGLDAAHRAQHLHLNLKPSQLLLVNEQIKVTDVGFPRLSPLLPKVGQAQSRSMICRTELFPAADFAAPERADDPNKFDPRADVYSLGCVLFYLIAGRPLYSSKTLLATLKAHRKSEIPSVQDFSPFAPPQLQYVLSRMVAKNPKQRYATMAELLEDLEILRSQPERLPKEPIKPHTKIRSERRQGEKAAEKKSKSKQPSVPQLPENVAALFTPAVKEFLWPVVGVFFALFLFCLLAGTHSLSFAFFQSATASLLAGTVWYFRDRVWELASDYTYKAGAVCGLGWGAIYYFFDFPLAAELDYFVLSTLFLGGTSISAVGVLLAGAGLGAIAGLDKRYGLLAAALGAVLPAAAIFATLALATPYGYDAACGRGEGFALRGRHARAISYFSEAIAMESENAKGFRLRAQSYYATKNYDKAIADLKKAIAYEPNNPQNHVRLAEVYRMVNLPQKAQAALDQRDALLNKQGDKGSK